jgi:hypothetical protein
MSYRVAISFTDITKIDVGALTNEQLGTLYGRIQADTRAEIAGMTGQEIESKIAGIVLAHNPDLVAVRKPSCSMRGQFRLDLATKQIADLRRWTQAARGTWKAPERTEPMAECVPIGPFPNVASCLAPRNGRGLDREA